MHTFKPGDIIKLVDDHSTWSDYVGDLESLWADHYLSAHDYKLISTTLQSKGEWKVIELEEQESFGENYIFYMCHPVGSRLIGDPFSISHEDAVKVEQHKKKS